MTQSPPVVSLAVASACRVTAAYSSASVGVAEGRRSASLSVRPNQAMWLWASWNPGSTVAPARSATSRAGRSAGPGSSAMIRPPAIATDRARGRAGSMVSTFALTSSRSASMGWLGIGCSQGLELLSVPGAPRGRATVLVDLDDHPVPPGQGLPGAGVGATEQVGGAGPAQRPGRQLDQQRPRGLQR